MNVVDPLIHVVPLSDPPAEGELVAIGLDLDVPAAEDALAALVDTASDRPDAAGLRRLDRYRRLSA